MRDTLSVLESVPSSVTPASPPAFPLPSKPSGSSRSQPNTPRFPASEAQLDLQPPPPRNPDAFSPNLDPAMQPGQTAADVILPLGPTFSSPTHQVSMCKLVTQNFLNAAPCNCCAHLVA